MKQVLHTVSVGYKRQKGSILILVLFILGVLITSSMHFYSEVTESTKISGASRDNAESLLLAESAMELLRGQYIRNLDTIAPVQIASCDVFGSSLDKCEASAIRANRNAPENFLMPYMYYVSSTNAIEKTIPTLLQKVADGEGMFETTSTTLASHKVPDAITELRVDNLFSAAFKPQLYTVDNNGVLVASAAANWAAETNDHKAAAWIEVVLNPADNTAVDLYVQATAQVGNARSFLQRYLGSYFEDDTLGALVSPLAESSNLNREQPLP